MCLFFVICFERNIFNCYCYSQSEGVADKYDCNISQLCSAWILHQKAVGSVILGLRAGITSHVEENKKIFTLKLSADHVTEIRDYVRTNFKPLPNDCGDEYR